VSRTLYFLSFVPILILVLTIAMSAQVPPAPASGGGNDSEVVTNADILKMVEAKLGDDFII
jgi:hypothetical protein